MNYKQRVRLLILALATACGVSVWGVAYFRDRSLSGVENWLPRLPLREAMLVYVDVAALRQNGVMKLLANAGTTEPEYMTFVRKTGFDYTEDLGAVLASFGPTGKYFIVKGRFDWKLLERYTLSQGGRCLYTFCSLNGSTPERKISFFPLARALMGLAVGKGVDAALKLQDKSPESPGFALPPKPVWVYLPGALLKNNVKLPESALPFASALENAHSLLLSMGPGAAGLEAGLDVSCRSEQDAAALEAQLQHVTTSLKEMMQRDNRSRNARDLSGVLASGVFRHSGSTVTGAWPVPQSFLEAMLGG